MLTIAAILTLTHANVSQHTQTEIKMYCDVK